MFKRSIVFFLCALFSLFPAWADGSQYATQSAMSEGKWVKIQVDATGIYKFTYADLKGMGFPDPAKVAVCGYGGWPLDEDFSKPYVDDLPVVPVWQGGDYLLFYAKGPVKWEYNASKDAFEHTNNPYATAGYYFLTDAVSPHVMKAEASVSGATQTVSTYDEYFVHEKELASVNYSGRELYGESFESQTTYSFNCQFPGITNDAGKAMLSFIARPENRTGAVVMSIGTETVVETAVGSVSATDSYTKAREVLKTGNWNGEKKEECTVKLLYGLSRDKNARLNYFRLQFKRELQPYGSHTFFRSIASIGKATRFEIQGAGSGTQVWDVTDGLQPKQMETTVDATTLSFSIPAGSLREFALVQPDGTFSRPANAGEVKNQNLHGLAQADMIIIAPAYFKTQAERLADLHRAPKEGLTVEVVDPQQIYNEFSSGTPDATAYRRFMKMFYDRSTSEGNPPRYLLLFGDGIYDNRGLCETGFVKDYGDRMLLTYQSTNSLNLNSYVTDDYFGFLDDLEGKALASDGLDIGIGRLPVRTSTEATQVVDKLIGYTENALTGVWKNQVCFVADDGNAADKYTDVHMSQAESLALSIEANAPEFIVNKVYLDAYKKDFTGGQTRYPAAQAKIQRLLKDGLLVLNYTGHGDTRSWTEERVMTESDIQQATYPYLPLWITATCDFTRFDDPVTSAGEQVLLNKASGGIGLFTTTRVVDSYRNFDINKQLINHLFDKHEGVRLALGDIMRKTKTALPGDANKLNFILIGDPAMKLVYPENRMEVTAVNGRPLSTDTLTFKALEKITIEGQVVDIDGRRINGFNGTAIPTVFDSQMLLKTLNNNGSGAFSYTDYTNKLYTGRVEMSDGTFSFTFEVPKDIAYSNEPGKLNLYAADDIGLEAQGVFLRYKVGGTAANVESDTDGPEIRQVYLNDTTFVEGGKVNVTPLLVARVWDKTGINITGSSLGHDILLTIDDSPLFSYVLNSYYEPVGNNGEGLVVFPVPELTPGMHTAEFVVWDVRNNSARDTITFEVVKGLRPALIELVATPNPAREQVEFRLVHNRPETQMEVVLSVYDLAGRLLWSQTEKGSSELFKSYIVTWNLTSNSGVRLRPGLYFYRAAIRTNHSKEATKANKLIILAQ